MSNGYLYNDENEYNDAREFYEGSDLDNWENNEVFNDHEEDDGFGPEMYDDGNDWDDDNEIDLYGDADYQEYWDE